MKTRLFIFLALACSAFAQVTALMPVPRMQFLDANGTPLAGGLLYTYAAGTTTPLATYTTSAGNVANANPVVLDSGGFAGIWLSPVAYKIVLKTSAGVTQWTVDNVYDWAQLLKADLASTSVNKGAYMIGYKPTVGQAVARTVQAKLDEIFSIKDFGAVCDNVTDDHVALQAAIDYAVSLDGGAVLEGPAGSTCYIGTTGLTVPATNHGITIHGPAFGSWGIRYVGSGAALTFGQDGSYTYRTSLEGVAVDITGGGVNAIGVKVLNCLYCSLVRGQITSTYNAATSRQVGLQLSGGVQSVTFGAYFLWDQAQVQGTFYRGVLLTGELGWGYNASQFVGGSIVSSGGHTAGTIGFLLHQGNQNTIVNLDVENFAIGIQSDAYDNTFIGSRTEGNTLGVNLTVRSGDCCAVPTSTTGCETCRLFGGSHSDGITNSTTAQIWATFAGSNYENHITGFAYLDTNLAISNNYAITWTGASGGSSGLFWKNGTGSAVDSLYSDATGIMHFQLGGVDYLKLNPNESPARGLEIPIGIYRNSAGFQHVKIPAASVCTTGATVGATCDWSITWNTPFVDANYTAVCSVNTVTAGNPVTNIVAPGNTAITGKLIATSAVASNGGIACVAIHW